MGFFPACRGQSGKRRDHGASHRVLLVAPGAYQSESVRKTVRMVAGRAELSRKRRRPQVRVGASQRRDQGIAGLVEGQEGGVGQTRSGACGKRGQSEVPPRLFLAQIGGQGSDKGRIDNSLVGAPADPGGLEDFAACVWRKPRKPFFAGTAVPGFPLPEQGGTPPKQRQEPIR